MDRTNDSESYNDLLEMIKEKYKNEYFCATLIKEHIENNYMKNVTQEELLYLTIHVQRVIEESISNIKGD